MASGDVLYKLIKFTDDQGKSFDFVPVEWIHYDSKLNDICTRFMPPPYGVDKRQELEAMVRSRISPPTDWPKYRVDIKGEARSYEEADERVAILHTENYAFSTDCEEHAHAKALADKKSYLRQKPTFDIDKVDKLMEVPPLTHRDEQSIEESIHDPDTSDVNCSGGSIDPERTVTYKMRSTKSTKKSKKIVLNGSSSSDETVSSKLPEKSYKRMRQSTSIKGKKNGQAIGESKKTSGRNGDAVQSAEHNTASTSSAVAADSVKPSSKSTAKQSAVTANSTRIKATSKPGSTYTKEQSPVLANLAEQLLPTKPIATRCDAADVTDSTGNETSKKMSTSNAVQSGVSVDSANGVPPPNHIVKQSAAGTPTSKKTSKTSAMLLAEFEEDDLKTVLAKSYLSLVRQQTDTLSAVKELKRSLDSFMNKFGPINGGDDMGQQINDKQNPDTLFGSLDLEFPLQTVEDFETFDERLKTTTINDQLKREIRCMVDPKSPLVRSISVIIKKFVSRDVIRSFTAVKKVAGKGVFKSTTFSSSIQDVVTREYGRNPKNSPINDKKFGDAVGSIINSAKDWEGKRLFRNTKGKPEEIVTVAASETAAVSENVADK